MNTRLIIILVLAGLIVLFTLQNAESIDVRFLMWTVSAPRALIVLSVLASGIVVGWLLHSFTSHRKPPSASPPVDKPPGV